MSIENLIDSKKLKKAGEQAGTYFDAGYNCAEAVFLTFRELLLPGMDFSVVRLMTGFGGGVGETGCVCGALATSVLALNMLKIIPGSSLSRNEASQYVKEFTDRFTKHNGGTCCRILNPHPYGTREQLANCRRITCDTCVMLAELMEEKKGKI